MKAIKVILAGMMLATVSAVFFCLGRNYESYYYNMDNLFEEHQNLKEKYDSVYEAACHMSDFIRSCKDWYEEEDSMPYAAFDETELVFLDEFNVKLSDYVWAY